MLLPVMAMTACGGSRLSHDAIVTAVNGGSPPAGVTQRSLQPEQQGAVSTLPQNGFAQPVPGGSLRTGGASGGVAGAGSPSAGGAGTTGGAGLYGSGPGTGASASSGSVAAKPAGPLAPILLGNVGTYSGPVGSSLASGSTGIQVWAAWVNAHGGVGGHSVRVFTADDGGDPARNRAVVQDMVENKHVVAFIANEVPVTVDASASYLEQKHIPVIGGDAATTPWTSSPVFFPGGTTFFPMLEATLKMAHDANATKYAILYCVEAPACNLMSTHLGDTASRYGEQVVYSSRISLTQPDFTAQCLGAQQAGAQAVYLGADASGQERIAASCARQNYHPLWVTSSQAVTTHMGQVPALDGMMAASPVFPWMLTAGNPEIDAYNEAIRQYAPGLEGSGATAIAWSSGELFKKAAAGIGATPTSDAILNGLWAMKNETVGGLTPPQTYVAHQPSAQIPCYFIVKASGGKWSAPLGDKYQCL
jgi:branched-chain amino acid transport system substrate-binding protein